MGLDTVELILKLEEHFDLRIPDADAERIETVGELQAFITQTLERAGREANPDRVFADIKTVLEQDFAVPARLIVSTARIVRDLGLE